MATATAQHSLSTPARQAVVSMYAGLALTAITSVIAPLAALATDVYKHHIETAYPKFNADKVSDAQQTMVIYLVANGIAGAVAWLWALRATKKENRRAPVIAVVLFTVALALALFNLLVKDSTGYAAFPLFLGIVGLLPCAAGLVAVVQLRRARLAAGQ